MEAYNNNWKNRHHCRIYKNIASQMTMYQSSYNNVQMIFKVGEAATNKTEYKDPNHFDVAISGNPITFWNFVSIHMNKTTCMNTWINRFESFDSLWLNLSIEHSVLFVTICMCIYICVCIYSLFRIETNFVRLPKLHFCNGILSWTCLFVLYWRVHFFLFGVARDEHP